MQSRRKARTGARKGRIENSSSSCGTNFVAYHDKYERKDEHEQLEIKVLASSRPRMPLKGIPKSIMQE